MPTSQAPVSSHSSVDSRYDRIFRNGFHINICVAPNLDDIATRSSKYVLF